MDKLGARNVLYSLERKQGLQHLASAAQCDTFPRKVHNPVIFLLQMWTRQKSPRVPNRPSLLRVAPDAQHWRELPRPGPPSARSIRADTGPPERTAELRTRRALPGDPRSPPRVPVHCARTRGPSGEGEDAVSTPAKSHRGSQPSLPGAEGIRGTRGTPWVGTGLSPHGLPSPGAQPHPRAQRPPPLFRGRNLRFPGRGLTPGRSCHSWGAALSRGTVPDRSRGAGSPQGAVPTRSWGAASSRGAAHPRVQCPLRREAQPHSGAQPHPKAQPHPRAQCPLHREAQPHPGAQPHPRAQSPSIPGRSLTPGRSRPCIPGRSITPGAVPVHPRAQPALPRLRASGADAAPRGGDPGPSGTQPCPGGAGSLPGGPARSPSGHPAGGSGSCGSRTPGPASPPARQRLHKRGSGGAQRRASARGVPRRCPRPRPPPSK